MEIVSLPVSVTLVIFAPKFEFVVFWGFVIFLAPDAVVFLTVVVVFADDYEPLVFVGVLRLFAFCTVVS